MGKRPGPPCERRYQITAVTQKHHEMKRYLLLGLENKEIAEILDCTPQNVSDVRNSQIFQEQIKILEVARDSATVDVARAIADDAGESYNMLKYIRDNPESGLALRAKVASDLLDRNPTTAKVRSFQGTILHGHLSPEDIEKIKKEVDKAKELAFGNGIIAEAEIVNEEEKEVV